MKLRKLLSLLLVFSMLLSMVPVSYAVELEDEEIELTSEEIPDWDNPQEIPEIIEEVPEAEEEAETQETPEEEIILESEQVSEVMESAYADSGTCGDNLTWTLDSEGTLEISGTGEMYDYDSPISDDLSNIAPWYDSGIEIVSAVVHEGVTSIGSSAFGHCTPLETVSLPSTLTSIHYDAFGDLFRLNSIVIPANVTFIGDFAFASCSNLTSITFLGDLPSSICENAFYGVAAAAYYPDEFVENYQNAGQYGGNLIWGMPTSGTCGENLTWSYDEDGTLTISGTGPMDSFIPGNQQAPWKGLNVVNVEIQSGVTSIGVHAFSDMDSIQTVSIPNTVTVLAWCAFYDCDSLTSLVIPESVSAIQSSVFSLCANLTKMTFLGDCPSITDLSFGDTNVECYYPADNSTYTPGETDQYGGLTTWIPMTNEVMSGICGDNLTWTLDSEGTLEISGTGNMYYYGTLNAAPWKDYLGDIVSVVIHDGATSIGDLAFFGCSSLASISLPNTVVFIGNYAFFGCSTLASITLPDAVMIIGNDAFRNCSALKHIAIPTGVSSIESRTFSACSSLASISLPDTVTSIESSAFSGCSSLESITLPGNLTSIGDYVFTYCTSLTSIAIPNSVTSIGSCAFQYSRNLNTIVFEGQIPACSETAFSNVTADVYYLPQYNQSPNVNKDYNGNLTWIASACLGNHTIIAITSKDATCTEDGLTEGTKCSVCNTIIHAPETIPMLGHSYAYAVTTKPTAEATGDITGTCSVCKATIHVSIPALNTSDYTYRETTPATTASAGVGTYTLKDTAYGIVEISVEIPALEIIPEKIGVISAAAAKGRPGETVTVTLDLSNNPGFAYAKFNVNYPSCMALVSAVNQSAVSGTFTTSRYTYVKPYVLQWSGATDSVGNGPMVTLTFQIAEDAPEGEYSLNIVCVEAYTQDFEAVGFEIESPVITVKQGLPGDANSDGIVNGKDGILFAQYLADWDVTIDLSVMDVNCDGAVNGKDSILLAQYLADWDVTLG